MHNARSREAGRSSLSDHPTFFDGDDTSHTQYGRQQGQEEQIQVHFDEEVDFDHSYASHGESQRGSVIFTNTQRAAPRRNSKAYAARVSRQRSRRRELLGRQAKPGITVDTSFTRHRGNAPHQVFPHDDGRGSISMRKSPWFGLGRSSTRNKGLGITKGTPQPGSQYRSRPSIDQSEPMTAVSLTPGSKTWQEISPWDRRIPIGISVPTDSISDFSNYQNRQRSGSDATLVTPSIVITPAAAMQSVWSPDTPFTESDYTPSIYSRQPFSTMHVDIPPVPALPVGIVQGLDVQSQHGVVEDAKSSPSHIRNDTLDSAGTAFEEEYEDSLRKNRIMSSGTVFEEDETPLREKIVETSLAIDTSVVPTPRRSQGWWNVITTPFVATPISSTWSQNGRGGAPTPSVPSLPPQYGANRVITDSSPLLPSHPPVVRAERKESGPTLASTSNVPAITIVNRSTISTSAHTVQQQTQQVQATPDRTLTSPLSAMSASPIVSTAAIGTVLMPRQVEENPRQININIELQDRRPVVHQQTLRANEPPNTQQFYTLPPVIEARHVETPTNHTKKSPQPLPVFAPPPTSAQKGSHFSYDMISRSSSPASTADLKKSKKHRKVCNIVSFMPFIKKKDQKHQDGQQEKKKKKKKGICFWGCCCCFILVILLAILIPVVVVLTKKNDDSPTATTPTQDGGSQWLNLPNYPPIPTGILTIAQPEAVEEESGCVAPTTLWSCALPKELQQAVKPNKPDQPNFMFEITFENGTAAELPKAERARRIVNAVSAGAFIRSHMLRTRSAPTPSPPAPNDADMKFMGQTTDGNIAPFEGETTGLFMTFQDPTISTAGVARRQSSSDPTNITATIPPPMLGSDGTAAAANLLPLPSAQPLRLYNRGKDNEHYGFYTYFDRSIFLKQINGTNRGGNPADTDGGSAKDAAKLRCTYAETRFLVQMWTRSEKSKPLLQNAASNASDVLKRPGTFPYPVTVTIDRHGGNAAKKNLYCYEMEDDGTIKNEASKQSFQFEDRGFGGVLVNGTQGQASASGPIDGGTGGCRCQWQNWLN
ncbi:hypothetical protein ACN47E_003071 [Coniothyrium glycines]